MSSYLTDKLNNAAVDGTGVATLVFVPNKGPNKGIPVVKTMEFRIGRDDVDPQVRTLEFVEGRDGKGKIQTMELVMQTDDQPTKEPARGGHHERLKQQHDKLVGHGNGRNKPGKENDDTPDDQPKDKGEKPDAPEKDAPSRGGHHERLKQQHDRLVGRNNGRNKPGKENDDTPDDQPKDKGEKPDAPEKDAPSRGGHHERLKQQHDRLVGGGHGSRGGHHERLQARHREVMGGARSDERHHLAHHGGLLGNQSKEVGIELRKLRQEIQEKIEAENPDISRRDKLALVAEEMNKVKFDRIVARQQGQSEVEVIREARDRIAGGHDGSDHKEAPKKGTKQEREELTRIKEDADKKLGENKQLTGKLKEAVTELVMITDKVGDPKDLTGEQKDNIQKRTDELAKKAVPDKDYSLDKENAGLKKAIDGVKKDSRTAALKEYEASVTEVAEVNPNIPAEDKAEFVKRVMNNKDLQTVDLKTIAAATEKNLNKAALIEEKTQAIGKGIAEAAKDLVSGKFTEAKADWGKAMEAVSKMKDDLAKIAVPKIDKVEMTEIGKFSAPSVAGGKGNEPAAGKGG